MAADMMAPLTSPCCMNMPMVNREFYSFCVIVYDDTSSEETKKRLIIPSGQFLTKESFRQKLYDKFGIGKDSCISYIDDDGDYLPIDLECEFQEALKLAKTLTPSKALVLVVRPWKLNGCSSIPDEERCDKMSKEPGVQNAENLEKMVQSCTSDLNSVTHATTDMVSKMNEKQSKFVPRNTRFQADDVINVLMRWHSPKVLHEDTLPPPWFTEYMEFMKKEMVSTITQEVVKQMTEMLNKHLDSPFTSSSNEASQSRRRPHSSLSKRHPRCSFDSYSIERNQKRMNAQDEAQFSDASIERVDEPQDVNVNVNAKDEDRQLRQAKLYLHDLDNIKGQIHKFLREKQYYRDDEMTNNLDIGNSNKQDRRESVQNVSHNNNVQEDVASSVGSVTSEEIEAIRRAYHMDDVQEDVAPPVGYVTSEDIEFIRRAYHMDDVQEDVAPPVGHVTSEEIEAIKRAYHVDDVQEDVAPPVGYVTSEDIEFIRRAYHMDDVQEDVAPPVGHVTSEEIEAIKRAYHVNNVQEDVAPPVGYVTSEEMEAIKREFSTNDVRKDVAPPVGYITSEEMEVIERAFRMNCSITGNQALNVDSFHENTWCDDLMEDIDKISHCSGCSLAADEREHVDTFVMVEMPKPENADPSFTQSKAPSAAELRQRDNSQDSPSLELLSESPSPRSSSYIGDEHFINVFPANETNSQTSVKIPSAYMVDIHGKIYNDHSSTTPDVNVDLEKRSDGVYSFVTETLPVREIDPSKSSHVEQQTFSEQKSSQCNTTGSSDDERNQPPSYSATVDDQRPSFRETFYWWTQSQTDPSDFMQSFHSHTTSVTDNNNDLSFRPYCSHAEQKTVTKDTARATTTSPRKTTRHNTSDKRSSRTRADETCREDSDKFFRSQQSSRTSGSDGCSNGSRRTSGEQVPNATVDPVFMLSETLLTMATQMGSVAYVSARDMFNKLRSHTKEDPIKRRRVKLNTATDGCSSSSATRRSANQP